MKLILTDKFICIVQIKNCNLRPLLKLYQVHLVKTN